jgi:hypothetical protein
LFGGDWVITGVRQQSEIAMKTSLTIRNCSTQFRFVCPKAWESLALTDSDDVRHCDHLRAIKQPFEGV